MTSLWTATTTPSWHGPGRVVPAHGMAARVTSTPKMTVSLAGSSKPTTLWGATHGDGTGGLAETRDTLKPNIWRLYENAGLTPSPSGGRTLPQWSDCAGSPSGLPAGVPIVYSSNPDINTMASRNMTVGTAYYNAVIAWRNILGTAPDDGTMLRHIFRHEPQQKSFTAASYAQAWLNWKADVTDYVNTQLGRVNKWFEDICGMGWMLDTPANKAIYLSYYPSDVRSECDAMGVDVYGLSQLQEGADLANTYGKPWAVPEFGGPHAGGSHGTYSEAQILASMQQWTPTIPAIKSGPTGAKVANPPLYVTWFNGNGTYITGASTPQSAAYWLKVDKGTAF